MKIPGVWKDGIERNLPGDSMVTVPDVATVWVSSNYRLRFVRPYQSHNLFSEFRCIFQSLVRMTKEYDLPYTQ